MPEGRQIVFSYQGMAEALVKQQGIQAGLWGISAEFDSVAANVDNAPGADLEPAAIVPLVR